jgi:hypothetical protein
MPAGWWTPQLYSTTATTAPDYLPTQTVVLSNPYSQSWLVQYINTSAYWPKPWQIVRPNPWSYLTAVEDQWRPAAPAVLRRLQRAQERVVAEMERAARQVEEQRQAASARARELLLGELDPVQRAQFLAEGCFEVIGKRARYRIRPAISANIDVLRRRGGGRVYGRLCVHPQGAHRMPVEDTMLAQLLHLRDDEARLLEIANRHPAFAA